MIRNRRELTAWDVWLGPLTCTVVPLAIVIHGVWTGWL